MSSQRYDAVTAREYTDRNGDKKTSFTKIGVAFPMRDRDGFSVQLEAIPAPNEGAFKILLMPPRPRDERADPAVRQPSRPEDLDDEIPF